MGVDYTANYGIGVRLESISYEDLEKLGYDSMDEYLDELPNNYGLELEYFETGSESYGGNDNIWFLCIKDPLGRGVRDLKNKMSMLKNHLNSNGIKYKGEIDLVGGLHIWQYKVKSLTYSLTWVGFLFKSKIISQNR